MGVPLSPQAQAFLQQKVFGHIATLMRDGSPQTTTVWVDTDGANILVNTVEGRVKIKNMRRDGRVALAVVDSDNPYRGLSIRGRVTSTTIEGAAEHYAELAKKYERPLMTSPENIRVKVVIEPLGVVERGL